MKASNVKILIAVLIVGLLTACGSQPTEAPASASQPTEVVVSATEAQVNSPAPADTAVIPTDAAVSLPTAVPTTDPSAQTATVSFANDVLPILESRCVGCHGGERVEEELILKTYADTMAGSKNGPVIANGDAENSLLAELVSTQKMPKKGPKLTPPQVQIIIDWINQGALNN